MGVNSFSLFKDVLPKIYDSYSTPLNIMGVTPKNMGDKPDQNGSVFEGVDCSFF